MENMQDMSLEKIKREIDKEREAIQKLRDSMKECNQLEQELSQTGNVDEDKAPESTKEATGKVQVSDTEWKIRYESQLVCNEALEKQIAGLQEKVLAAQQDLRTLQKGGQIDAFKGASPQKTLIKLKRQKQNLESELKDLEWRLDHEATAFYKADEKRKAMLKDIKAKGTTKATKGKGQTPAGKDKKAGPPKGKVDQTYSKRLSKVSKPSNLYMVKEK